jgi:serine/threonine protein kinase
VLWDRLGGYHPFDLTGTASRALILESMRANRIIWMTQPWDSVSLPVKELIQSMMARDPATRPSASVVLAHPWLSPEAAVAPVGDAMLGIRLDDSLHGGDFTLDVPVIADGDVTM